MMTLGACCWGLPEEKAFVLMGEPPQLLMVLITSG